MTEQDVLHRAYAAYNSQDLNGLLALVSDDVDWPDDAGGRLVGRAAVEAYWSEQWDRLRTHDRPVALHHRPDGTVEVRIEQVVRSLDGSVISTGSFRHLLRVEGSRITRLDVEVG